MYNILPFFGYTLLLPSSCVKLIINQLRRIVFLLYNYRDKRIFMTIINRLIRNELLITAKTELLNAPLTTRQRCLRAWTN